MLDLKNNSFTCNIKKNDDYTIRDRWSSMETGIVSFHPLTHKSPDNFADKSSHIEYKMTPSKSYRL